MMHVDVREFRAKVRRESRGRRGVSRRYSMVLRRQALRHSTSDNARASGAEDRRKNWGRTLDDELLAERSAERAHRRSVVGSSVPVPCSFGHLYVERA